MSIYIKTYCYLFFYLSNFVYAEFCEDYVAERIPLFGDLHVHTALSLDAATQGTINRPADAYRFALGQSISLQPYDKNGASQRSAILKRPLDFMAVTDHAELLGEVALCEDSNSLAYNSLTCMTYRNLPQVAYYQMNTKASLRSPISICGKNRANCLEAAKVPWRETIDSAERFNAVCHFTTFVGYEWTGAKYSGNNLHRNVIFNSFSAPNKPISFYEAPTREDLWQQLDDTCKGDCEYVIIPHNSNLSNSYMFEDPSINDLEIIQSREPIIEIFQHKGSSECNDINDKYCDFELLPYKDFSSKFFSDNSNVPASSFVRYGLNRGIEIKDAYQINPFKYGFIASTDTHLATAGAVDETLMQGHGGAGKSHKDVLPEGLPDDIESNPGGLAVVWAEENSRSSIFAALKRRETYATSGPRFIVRFFGGDNISDNSCSEASAIKNAYESGVPMGGSLDITNMETVKFFMMIQADPQLEDHFIEAVQLIKSSSKDSQAEIEVISVFDDSINSELNLNTCQLETTNPKSFCEVWEDDQFDPNENAYYYLRVISSPTCRWSHELCIDNPDMCEEGTNYPKFIHERAWTSPIWLERN